MRLTVSAADVASLRIGTVNVLLVSPAAKLSVPEVGLVVDPGPGGAVAWRS